MRRSLALATVTLAAVLLVPAGCGDDDSSDATTTSSSSTTSLKASTTTTVAAGAGASTTTIADAPPATTATGFPPARADLQHGGTTWAVVLTGAEDADAPSIQQAVQAAAAAGYTTGPTDCDVGAAEALDMADGGTGVYTVSVYFDTQAQAEQALTAFHQHGYDAGRVAQVTTYCLD